MSRSVSIKEIQLRSLVLISASVLLLATGVVQGQTESKNRQSIQPLTIKNNKSSQTFADRMKLAPTVAFINSRECPVCAKVRPIMKDLQQEYGERVRFINLDISDDKNKAESKKIARSLLLGQFFNLYSDSFPCVGIFDKQNRTVRELCGFNSKQKYEGYIRKALNESLK